MIYALGNMAVGRYRREIRLFQKLRSVARQHLELKETNKLKNKV